MSQVCEDCGDPQCSVPIALGDDEPIAYSQCLERQLIAQAALLRSVTGKLESCVDILDIDELMPNRNAAAARILIQSVLEVLS